MEETTCRNLSDRELSQEKKATSVPGKGVVLLLDFQFVAAQVYLKQVRYAHGAASVVF